MHNVNNFSSLEQVDKSNFKKDCKDMETTKGWIGRFAMCCDRTKEKLFTSANPVQSQTIQLDSEVQGSTEWYSHGPYFWHFLSPAPSPLPVKGPNSGGTSLLNPVINELLKKRQWPGLMCSAVLHSTQFTKINHDKGLTSPSPFLAIDNPFNCMPHSCYENQFYIKTPISTSIWWWLFD